MAGKKFLTGAVTHKRPRLARAGRPMLLVMGISVLGALAGGPVTAGGLYTPPPSPVRDQRTIVVPINKSRIVDLRRPIARVSVANPAIADILVVNPTQIYIVGKELGTTNMVLWGKNDQVQAVMGLEVSHDLQSLKQKMYHYLPGEHIRIESAQGAIVLSGEVSSVKKMNAAVQLAQSYAASAGGKSEVMNMLQVGGAQQVLLEVKVAEVSRSFLKRLDVNFNAAYNGGNVKIGTVAGGASFPNSGIPIFGPVGGAGLVGPFMPGMLNGASGEGYGSISSRGIYANFLNGNFFFNLVLDAAKDEGLARILAEPNLTTMSGQEANFLAGGQFPVPTAAAVGTAPGVSYKNYGIGLTFVPMVLDSGLISMKVTVSVSQLSNANAVLIPSSGGGNYVVPSLTMRSANAAVEVPSGQTIAIAGLINENLIEDVNKLPALGELPVIGSLFRSQNYQKNQTELVIFVTPRLARPTRTETVQLPTDNFVEPSDVEFYLLGHMQGRKPGQETTTGSTGELGPDKSGSEGYFGHDL